MKVKVSEATEVQLDWMVAKAEGFTSSQSRDETEAWLEHADGRIGYSGKFNYSTDWSQGGPIIEREGILLRPLRRGGHTLDGQWLAMFDGENTGTMVQWVKRTDWIRHYWSGPTPLIAAMRAFVASRLGDTPEVPDELA